MFEIWGTRSEGVRAHRARKRTRLLAPALAGVALAASVMMQTAVASPLDNLASLFGLGDAASAAAADHVVSDTVSPSGTTIDLFDYWLTTDDGNESPANITSAGINSGNQLWFSGGIPEGSNADYGKTINHYTGAGKGPKFDIVASELGDDGYPKLKEGNKYGLSYNATTTAQSLAYLFNPLVPNTYKKSHANVSGLLQLDADGYYYYDSTENFASYDEEANSFVLYDGAAVDGSGYADQAKGMFFPFNTAEQVFTPESLNGTDGLKSTITPNDGVLNHYFGLSMTSYFMQPAEGKSNGQDMVFEFSGDDDVWVFIDGRLVGDVGGIHDRVGLTINFATGAIKIYNAGTAGEKNKVYKNTTFAEIFGTNNLESGRFKTGSYHTLKFYYLERGSGSSNMSLKYNLVDIPASTMTKVDQLGKGVPGAKFELYKTDASHQNEELIGSGVTDTTGSFTFTDASGVPINFMNLNASGISHYVLKETETPEGYRKSPDGRLKYVTNADKSMGFLLSDNYWESGVYARPEQVVTIGGGSVKVYGTEEEIPVADDVVFAVILKRDRSVDDLNACWHAVAGNSVDGWTVAESAITDTSQLEGDGIQKVYFKKNEDGKYVADLKELPGDPEQYYAMASKENQESGNFDYTVGFYARDSRSNIKRLETDAQNFQRQSAANLHVTDIMNALHVQKVDDAGAPVDGVTFDLYRSNQMVEAADGKLVPGANEVPAFTGETKDNRGDSDATIKMDGMLSLGPLSPGTYYLVENAEKTPKGYIPNDAVIRVIVDDEGVHADAGVEGDGVTTLAGIGSLVDSMSQFGVKDDIDMTLYRVVATKATATASDEDGDGAYKLGTWMAGTDKVTMENSPDSAYLEYVPVNPSVTEPGFTVDAGYVRATVSQAPDKPGDLGMANWTDLSKVDNKNLSALFTGTNVVRVANQRTASLAVSKEVAVPTGFTLLDTAKDRDFTLTFTFENLGNLSAGTEFDAATFKRDENGDEQQVDDDYTIKSGGTHTIKHGETIKVYGLPNGATFTVSEKPDALYPQTQPADKGSIAGEVAAGETKTGTFVNTYAPKPVVLAADSIKYEKKLDNWDVIPDATFDICLSTSDPSAPLPDWEPVSEDDRRSVFMRAEIDSPSGKFGSITFDTPGAYRYSLYEKTPAPDKQELGVDYSMAVYRVIVTVTDDGAGSLSATVQMVQTADDQGFDVDPHNPVDSATATFTNRYDLTSSIVGLRANKVLVDESGSGRVLKPGEFTFKATALADAPKLSDPVTENVADGLITFGVAEFTEEHVGHTYTYKLEEVVPTSKEPGMTYDSAVFYAHVAVTKESKDGDPAVKTTVTYSKDEEGKEPITTETPAFTNTYQPDAATLAGDAHIKGEKTLIGRDALDGETFTFRLAALDDFTKQALVDDVLVFGSNKDATELTAQAKGAKNGVPCAFTFDSDMTFTKVGTYRFAIEEVAPTDPAPNLTYDPTTAEAVVTVTDDGGKLKAEVSYINPQNATTDRAVFTNTYHATGTFTTGIEVSKVLTGRAMKAKEFSATVAGIENVEGGTTAAEAAAKLSRADAEFSFPKASDGAAVSKTILSDVLFTEADAGKTFSYLVSEKLPAEGVDTAGVSYDRSRYRVDLAVMDKGDGSLTITPAVTKVAGRDGNALPTPETVSSAVFENRYAPAETTIVDTAGALPLTKKLAGRDWLDRDSFEFTLTAKSLDGKTDADALASVPMPADATVAVTSGSPSHYDGATGTVPDVAIKDFGFKNITYSQAGTYVYEVREVVPDDATHPSIAGSYKDATPEQRAQAGWIKDGVTYDSATVATVTCEVKDNLTGQLYVEAHLDRADAPTFTNTYAAGTATDASLAIQATKTFVNHALDAGDFEFGIAPYRNDGTLGDEVLSGSNAAAAADVPTSVTFDGTLSYTTEGLAKAVKAGYAYASVDGAGHNTWTLKYLAYEKELDAGEHPGVTQTASSFNFTVAVTDNGDGTLTAVANYPAGGLAFVNTYNTEGDNSVTYTPTGAKVLQTASDGLAAPDIDGRYQFTLAGEDGAPMPAGNGGVTVNDRSSVNFGAITFTLDMLKGTATGADGSRSKTFTYTVSEEGFVPGVTNDTDSKTFKLTLTDDGKGHLTVTPGGDPKLPLFTFVNTYTAQVPESDPVTTDGMFAKVLTGRDWMRSDAFTFAIEPVVEGTPMPEVTQVVLRRESAESDALQTFGFGKITFTYDDMKGSVPNGDGTSVEKTFEYTVREVAPADAAKAPGITYSDNVAHLVITLTDDGRGNLTATYDLTDDAGTANIDENGDVVKPATFTNVYNAELNHNDAGGIVVTKTTNGHDMTQGQFTFRVETLDGDGITAVETARRIGIKDGTTVEFGNIAGASGEKVEMPSERPITFTHEDVGKTFKLKISEQGADGSFGTGGTAEGYTFSDAVYTVEMSVADDGKGALTITTKVVDKDGKVTEQASSSADPHATYLDFVNTYTPDTIAVDPDSAAGTVTKVLAGNRDTELAADEFAFLMKTEAAQGTLDTVKDAQGKAWPAERTAANAADGSVDFGSMSFSAAGTYKVSITEVAGDDTHIAYDGHTFKYTIEVSYDPATGKLSSEVTDISGTPEFTNVYTADDAKDVVTGDMRGSLDGKVVRVGDELTYTIDWVNNALGADAAPAKADVTVTDVVPAGAEFVSAEVGGVHKDGAVTWELGEQEPGACGTVSFTVKVTEDALVTGGVENEATIQIGDTDPVTTNKVTTGVQTASVTVDTSAAGVFSKELQGRDWIEGDEFSFTLTPLDGAPLPDGAEAGSGTATTTVKAKAGAKAGEKVPFGFGTISFDTVGTYRYEVHENAYDIAGMKPQVADQVAVMTITVTDDGTGKLSAAVPTVDAGTFVNVYESGTVDVDAAGGVQVVKTMTGRAIGAGDFAFTMTPVNDAAKGKFGSDAKTVETAGAALGGSGDANVAVESVKLATGMTFTQADAGTTFEFTVVEKNGGAEGYTYDATVHELAFLVADDSSTGTLSVEVKLDGTVVATWSATAERAAGDAVSIPFANSYDAGSVAVGGDDGVALEATKVLIGRPMVAGEFRFNVVNAADTSDTPAVVATGSNDAAGQVRFSGITFTNEQLNRDVAAGLATVDRTGDADVFTYVYTVREDTAALDEGVTPVTGTQTFTVRVTDNGAGELAAEVVYPDGGMEFENAYGASATAELAFGGTKVLKAEEGANAPDIAGKFQFTLTGSAGAPLPDETTVANDAAGNVSFGKIAFTMENAFGEDAEADAGAGVAGAGTGADDAPQPVSAARTKTFTYTVSESGNVPGVTNDPEVKTIEVTVTDNGDGTLSVSKSTAGALADYTFTNVYRTDAEPSSPTGEGALMIKKTLTGRDLRAGEFTFELTNAQTGEVFTAVNDEAGNVSFPEIMFTESGAFVYELREAAGDVGGVTYDRSAYGVMATVIDDGTGSLDVTWAASKDGQPIEDNAVTFENTYKAAPTNIAFNAAKVLKGRDIIEGEFAFELRDSDGTVLQTVKNGKATSDGSAPVTFEAIDLEKPGEYDFELAEVVGDAEGVTYDTTVFTYHVVVTDDGSGQLKVTWTEGENGAPVFCNSYEKPEDPEVPVEPADPDDGSGGAGSDLPGTGDGSMALILGVGVVGLVAAGVGIAALRKRDRS